MKIFCDKIFRLALLLIILAEMLSFLGYLAPAVNLAIFLILVILSLTLAIYHLELALWLLIAEVLISSKGYLFFADFVDARISIRLALWSVVMLVWLAKSIAKIFREKNRGLPPKLDPFLKNNYLLVALGLAVVWGAINGLLIQGHAAADVFFDANAWLFFLLILPAAEVFSSRESLGRFLPVASAAVIWLAGKTFFLSYIFSHFTLDTPAFRLYRWVRVSGVGEITQAKGGFYRIFFQSQIYVLASYLVVVVYLGKLLIQNKLPALIRDKKFQSLFTAASVLLAVILLSLSRSFWLGLAAGLLVAAVCLGRLARANNAGVFKKLLSAGAVLAASLILSAAIIAGLVLFPAPKPLGGFSTDTLLASRLDSEEAAAVSRWELLPKLLAEIKTAPLLGKGFGAAITYRSSDPRQLASPNHGLYTTYAFEWGWLDFWLKFGLFGVLIYLALIFKLAKNLFSKNNDGEFRPLYLGLGVGLIAVSVVHFFSPYLGHPLGILLVILAQVLPQAETPTARLAGQ